MNDEIEELPEGDNPIVDIPSTIDLNELESMDIDTAMLLNIDDNLVILNDSIVTGTAWILTFLVIIFCLLSVNLFFVGIKAGRSND